ncbi:MAG: response regulator, partial [Mesorhizobium sp.]|nr:response regulator [Mesorhizobium sp.]
RGGRRQKERKARSLALLREDADFQPQHARDAVDDGQAEAEALRLARARPRGTASLAGLKVACIDNDARILEGMRLLLEGWGCSVTTLTGSHGIGTDMPRPDIVLADYHLDGETGLEAIAAIRALHGEQTPAVLVTAARSSEVRAAAAEMDVPVVNKPLKPAVLRTTMARMRMLAAAE